MCDCMPMMYLSLLALHILQSPPRQTPNIPDNQTSKPSLPTKVNCPTKSPRSVSIYKDTRKSATLLPKTPGTNPIGRRLGPTASSLILITISTSPYTSLPIKTQNARRNWQKNSPQGIQVPGPVDAAGPRSGRRAIAEHREGIPRHAGGGCRVPADVDADARKDAVDRGFDAESGDEAAGGRAGVVAC